MKIKLKEKMRYSTQIKEMQKRIKRTKDNK
jgi:hypothetical protein